MSEVDSKGCMRLEVVVELGLVELRVLMTDTMTVKKSDTVEVFASEVGSLGSCV